jgi:hypothetical protein
MNSTWRLVPGPLAPVSRFPVQSRFQASRPAAKQRRFRGSAHRAHDPSRGSTYRSYSDGVHDSLQRPLLPTLTMVAHRVLMAFNGGHVILPIGGQKSPHWRTRDLPKGGQQNSRS